MDVELASTKDFTSTNMIGVEKDDKFILIAKVDDNYYAMGDICTHMGCNLSDGDLQGDKVTCPCHGSIFDVRTGQVVKGPAKDPEPSYSLRLEGDKIIADI